MGRNFSKHIHDRSWITQIIRQIIKLFSTKNKSKLGYFKDELAGREKCIEFVGLRIKMLCDEI